METVFSFFNIFWAWNLLFQFKRLQIIQIYLMQATTLMKSFTYYNWLIEAINFNILFCVTQSQRNYKLSNCFGRLCGVNHNCSFFYLTKNFLYIFSFLESYLDWTSLPTGGASHRYFIAPNFLNYYSFKCSSNRAHIKFLIFPHLPLIYPS